MKTDIGSRCKYKISQNPSKSRSLFLHFLKMSQFTNEANQASYWLCSRQVQPRWANINICQGRKWCKRDLADLGIGKVIMGQKSQFESDFHLPLQKKYMVFIYWFKIIWLSIFQLFDYYFS